MMKRKVLSLLLAGCLALGNLPVASLAQENDASCSHVPRQVTDSGDRADDGAFFCDIGGRMVSGQGEKILDTSAQTESGEEEQTLDSAAELECTCGAQPDENGTIVHAEDCPLYVASNEAQLVIDAINALPEPESLDGYYKNAPAGEIAAARELVDGLSEEALALIPQELLEKLSALEHIRDMFYDCPDLSCPWHYPPEILAQMNESEDPAPLTLSDLVENYDVAPPIMLFPQSRAVTNPKTIVIKSDNENNAHTGTPDGDIDSYLGREESTSPIEVSFDLDRLPTQSAYLAIKAYDVDEEDGERDRVYVNFQPANQDWEDTEEEQSHSAGFLSGTNNTWNTTVLKIPLDQLKVGKNYITITMNISYSQSNPNVLGRWATTVDWMQLVLDGGEQDSSIENFDLTLGTPINSSNSVRVPATVTIEQTGNSVYQTEYTLLQTSTGNALDAVFGSASTKETVTLSMPGNSPAGEYEIVGVLKDENETIKAMDTAAFLYENGQAVLRPKLDYTLTPDGLTNQNVTIHVFVADDMGYDDIQIQDNDRTVSENGNYDFTVTYSHNGQKLSYLYTVTVDSIDKIPPVITSQTLTVTEDTPDDEVREYLEQSVTVTDNRGIDVVEWEIPESIALSLDAKTIKITARDLVGNETTETCSVVIQPKPFELILDDPAATGAGSSFGLSATLAHTGGLTFDETGFVWGAMQNPTLTVNNGSAKTDQAINEKGGQIAAVASEIVSGINYYVRAYARTTDGQVYYSEQKAFGVGAKQYGVFSVENNGDNTFDMIRTNGTDGDQVVYYRTVNGSAVGGTHFTHKSGSVTVPAGQDRATVSIEELGVNQTYQSNAATGYANAGRTYQVEIYRVDGGAILGSETRATRTMTGNQTVSRALFEDFAITKAGTNHEHGDYDDDKRGWTDGGKYYEQALEVIQISSLLSTPDYWRALPTAQVQYRMQFEANEGPNDGYEHMQIASGQMIDLRYYPYQGSWNYESDLSGIERGERQYQVTFEHGGSRQDTSYAQYYLPASSGANPSNCDWAESYTGSPNPYVTLPLEEDYVTVAYCASGSGQDKWNTRNETHFLRVGDTQEPQLLGVAPMAGETTYKPGDQITVSLIFNEIVDSENSPDLSANVSISTSWGNLNPMRAVRTPMCCTLPGRCPALPAARSK